MKMLPWILIFAGVAINIADAYTAHGDPAAGYFYGDQGVLRGVNAALPINVGLLLIFVGAGLFIYQKVT